MLTCDWAPFAHESAGGETREEDGEEEDDADADADADASNSDAGADEKAARLLLATGGADGLVRVWSVPRTNDAKSWWDAEDGVIPAIGPGEAGAAAALPSAADAFRSGSASASIALALGAFVFTLVPIRPRWSGERRSLRTFPGVSLRPGSLAFNPFNSH